MPRSRADLMGLTGVPSTDRAEHGSWCCRRLVAHDTTSFIPSSVNRLDSIRLVTVPTYSEIFDERASTESGRQKMWLLQRLSVDKRGAGRHRNGLVPHLLSCQGEPGWSVASNRLLLPVNSALLASFWRKLRTTDTCWNSCCVHPASECCSVRWWRERVACRPSDIRLSSLTYA